MGLICGGRDYFGAKPRVREGPSRLVPAVLVCILLVSSALAALMVVEVPETGPGPTQLRTEAYAPLPPFRIDSNAEFGDAAAANGWSGSGTEADPYIVSGYEVDATGEAEAVYIGNTTVHFTMSSCWLHGGGSSGLTISRAKNASISSNVLSGANAGVDLSFSANITITNNSFADCPTYGIYCFTSNSLNISQNTFAQSSDGIRSVLSRTSLMIGNTFDNCTDSAICLYDSTSMTLGGNTMDRCGIKFVGHSANAWSTHQIDGANTVNGKAVFYASNQDRSVVAADAGQVILAKCSNMSVEGRLMANASASVQVGYSSFVTVSNSSFSGEGEAVSFAYSNDFVVSNNTVADCGTGIKADYSRNFTVENNTCARNGNGLSFFNAKSFEVRNNTVNDSYPAGIRVDASKTGIFRDNSQTNNGFLLSGYAVDHWASHDMDASNTVNGEPVLYASGWNLAAIDATGYGQVIVANSTTTSISSANVTNATAPIQMGFSSGCTISNSNCSGGYAGMILYGCSDTVIHNSTAWNNEYGVIVTQSVRTRFENDTLGDNPVAGLYSLQSQLLDMGINDMYRCGIWLEGFDLEDFGSHSISTDTRANGKPVYYIRDQVGGTVPEDAGAVILVNCSDIVVANETTDGATLGIHINFCYNITVSNCTSRGNLDGLEMLKCYDSVVRNCTFSDNYYGIVASTSSRNVFRDNLVWGSTSWGFYLSAGSFDNLVCNSTFSRNMGSGDAYDPLFIQAFDGGVGNLWNSSSGGNYWGDWTSPDANGDGIVDIPYVLSGPAVSKDRLPLTEPAQVIPEFGALVPVMAAIALLVMISCITRTRNRRD